MGKITLNKSNRLFWLGRYAERVYQNVECVRDVHEDLLDGKAVSVDDLCLKLGIPNVYESPEDFCNRFSFDSSISQSILTTADAMIGNGMVLREVLGSQTLSYLQMTVTALEAASLSTAVDVQLQWVLDDIMAFRGSYAEYIDAEEIRSVIRCGASVERIGTLLRFDAPDAILRKQMHRLLNRMYKTRLQRNEESVAAITEYAFNEGEGASRFGLLGSVESLFVI